MVSFLLNSYKNKSLTDEEIIQELVPLFGIGRWTVEMFLIFHLGRLDVWPVDDLAVRRGWDNLHGNSEPIKPKVLQGFYSDCISSNWKKHG